MAQWQIEWLLASLPMASMEGKLVVVVVVVAVAVDVVYFRPGKLLVEEESRGGKWSGSVVLNCRLPQLV